MHVNLLEEAGIRSALWGLSLSYNSEPSEKVADRLSHRGGGHSKFLESCVVWLDINAPRYWWQQFDTYRVGTTKQSESTMHTIMRSSLDQENFEGKVDWIFIGVLNNLIKDRDFDGVKKHLPESFLQRRQVCTNYMVLQNMERQRRSHKLYEWTLFLDRILETVEKPKWIRQ